MSPRVAARVSSFKRTLIREIFESAPKDALNLGLGQPDFDPPAPFVSALERAAASPNSGYGPTAGEPELRVRVAQEYVGLARGAQDVLITQGCQQATFTALGGLLDPGDEILVPDPGFPGAECAALSWGAVPVPYRLKPKQQFRIDVDALLDQIGPRTRAILVITPSNPIGVVEPQSTMIRLAQETERRGIALVVDEIYRDFHWAAEGPAPGAPREPLDHLVVCGGLSKNVALTGWRVGWAICRDAAFMEKLTALQQTLLTCPSTPVQRAAVVAFEPEGRAAAAAIKEVFRARRDLVCKTLQTNRVDAAPLDGAFYSWLDVGHAGGGREFARRLLEQEKIVVIPGEGFGTSSPDWIRVSYCQPRERLQPALEIIASRAAR